MKTHNAEVVQEMRKVLDSQNLLLRRIAMWKNKHNQLKSHMEAHVQVANKLILVVAADVCLQGINNTFLRYLQ